jgi:hypothetical protein
MSIEVIGHSEYVILAFLIRHPGIKYEEIAYSRELFNDSLGKLRVPVPSDRRVTCIICHMYVERCRSMYGTW